MNRSVYYISSTIICTLLLAGCVSQSKFLELEEQKNFYEAAYTNVDSLEAENETMKQEVQDMNTFLKQAFQEVEKLTVANQSLNRNYQELRKRYEQIAQTNNSVVSNTSFEVQNLQEQIASKQAELDQKEAYLKNLERDLAVRQQQLNQIRTGINNNTNPADYSNTNTNPQLDNQITLTQNQLQQLRASVGQAFYGTPANEVSITQKAGELVVTLSQSLLFPDNSNDRVNNRGRILLAQLAQALNSNPGIGIQIVGNTDSDGNPTYNWDRSVIRASAVAKELIALNVNPARITAAGRSSYAPVQNNNSPQGRMANNRTEIILTPDYSGLLNLIQR